MTVMSERMWVAGSDVADSTPLHRSRLTLTSMEIKGPISGLPRVRHALTTGISSHRVVKRGDLRSCFVAHRKVGHVTNRARELIEVSFSRGGRGSVLCGDHIGRREPNDPLLLASWLLSSSGSFSARSSTHPLGQRYCPCRVAAPESRGTRCMLKSSSAASKRQQLLVQHLCSAGRGAVLG